MRKTPEALTFTYTNWRGETAERRVRPSSVIFRFAGTEWHPEPQWLMSAIDLDKVACRDFAVRDIVFASALPLAVPDAVGVQAKKLDWIEPTPHEDEETFLAAPGLGGRYSISHQQSLHIGGQEHLLWWAHDGFTFAEFRTVDEAKAAAQADFDHRILSFIRPTPPPICSAVPRSDTLAPGQTSTAAHAITSEPSESIMPENDNRQTPDATAVEPAPVKTADDPWKVEAIETVLEIAGEIDLICDDAGHIDPRRKHELPVYLQQLRAVLPIACGAAERAAGRSRPRYGPQSET